MGTNLHFKQNRLIAALLMFGTFVSTQSSSSYLSINHIDLVQNRSPLTTIYVDASNTGYEDGSQAHPFNTIQEGLGIALNGDKVQVAAGTYFEKITMKSGVQLIGDGMKTTIIDGINQSDSVITVSNTGTGTRIEGFSVIHGSGKPSGGYSYGGGFYITDAELTIRDCWIYNNHASDGVGGIQIKNSTVLVENSIIEQNQGWWNGAIAIDGGDVTIKKNLILSNSSFYGGSIAINQGANVTIANNLIRNNSASAIVNFGTDMVVIVNNTIVNNSGYGVSNDSGEASITIRNNIIWGNYDDLREVTATYSDIEDGDPGEGNISIYPMFIQEANGNYHLRRISLCIDAGTGNGAPTDDIDGDPRPIDGNGDGIAGFDMGYDEYYPPKVTLALPIVDRSYCIGFYDNFSDPASGWEEMEDDYVLSEYTHGEFLIHTKKSGYLYLYRSPACVLEDYTVEVDARWGEKTGNSYGLLFDIQENFSYYYFFDINSDYQMFRLYRRTPSGFTSIVGWTASSAIRGGHTSNHLKVTRSGNFITLNVNGVELGTWMDDGIKGTGGTGIISSPYSDRAKSDALFDNFNLTSLASNSPGTDSAARTMMGVPIDTWPGKFFEPAP
jgi:hypothetical protein